MENSKKVSLVGTVLFTVCSILVLDSFVAPAIIGVFLHYGMDHLRDHLLYRSPVRRTGTTFPDDGGIVEPR